MTTRDDIVDYVADDSTAIERNGRTFVLDRLDRNKAPSRRRLNRTPPSPTVVHTLLLSITKLTGAIVPGPSVMMSRAPSASRSNPDANASVKSAELRSAHPPHLSHKITKPIIKPSKHSHELLLARRISFHAALPFFGRSRVDGT